MFCFCPLIVGKADPGIFVNDDAAVHFIVDKDAGVCYFFHNFLLARRRSSAQLFRQNKIPF